MKKLNVLQPPAVYLEMATSHHMKLLPAFLLFVAAASPAFSETPPPPPPAPATTVDQAIFDVFQGSTRRAIESYEILRHEDMTIGIRGEITMALPSAGGGSDQWKFYPDTRYGERGLKSYDLRAKFPTGPGSTTVRMEGGKCSWTFQGPNNQNVGPRELPLPVNGLVLDKRVLAHFAYFGLLSGERSRMVLDPDTARVAEARLSESVPARIEAPVGSILCERVLVTIGSFGANLWFNEDGFLLRVEIPHFGIVAVRRGFYGYSGPRSVAEAVPDDGAQEILVQDGRARMAGSILRPRGNAAWNTVVILSDSGPQDRKGNPPGDSLFWNHYLQWARAFRDEGVAAVILDDTGTGFSVEARSDETLSDYVLHARAVLAWVRSQPDLKDGRIGVLGHGEGALAALQLAVNGDADFAVLVAAHGRPVGDLYLAQSEMEMRRQGVPEAVMTEKLAEDRELQRLWLDPNIKLWKSPEVPERFELIGGPRAWFRDLSSFKPLELAVKVKGPVMLVHGDADVLVPAEDAEKLAAVMAEAKKDVTLRRFPGLDHLLMPRINGDSGDSADPDRRTDREAARAIGEWIRKR